jgi:hypothetical protein
VTHRMTAETETRDEVLFACAECPRRIVVGKRRPGVFTVDEGDQVPHVGGLNGMPALHASVR